MTGNPSTWKDMPASTLGSPTVRCMTIKSQPYPIKEVIKDEWDSKFI